MRILGLGGGPRGSHEPGCCLLEDGKTRYVLMEERFNRFKNSVSCFPHRSLLTLFQREGIDPQSINLVAHPGLTYEDMKVRWPLYLEHNFGMRASQHLPVHHQLAHLASSFFYSDFDDALVITLDGVGDKASGAVAVGEGAKISVKEEFSPGQSVGFFWNVICQFIGYEPMEEAYKTMGLAAYGTPRFALDDLLHFRDGSLWLNPRFLEDKWRFVSKHPLERNFTPALAALFGEQPRTSIAPLRQVDRDIAASAQKHLEEVMVELVNHYLRKYGKRRLCLAGGVALNSKMCGLLNQQIEADQIFVSPCPSDGGLPIGAALYAHAEKTGRRPEPIRSPFQAVEYSDEEILTQIRYSGLPSRPYDEREVAGLLASDRVIGFFNGRSELGPRALGHRSIVASPLKPEMKDVVNKKIKFREEFRPFAPATCDIDFDTYFERGSGDYSYMSFTVQAKAITRRKAPAIVHIDGTSRVQEVYPDNAAFYRLIQEFGRQTGVPVLMNTSFNLKGEPIVETPSDALRTFISSDLDHLVLNQRLVSKPGR